VRRWVAEATALDDRYLQTAGRMLLTPAAWRSFVREQRCLVRDLPALERRLPGIAAARRLRTQIPGAELVEVEHAGHLLHVQQAGRLAEVVLSRS